MHFAHPRTHLPSAEFTRLQALLLTMIGARTPFADLLRRKLGSSDKSLVPTSMADQALAGRRVRYRVDRRRPDESKLVWTQAASDDHLSLLSLRGMALLGLSAGQGVFYRTERGRTEFIELEQVVSGGNGPAGSLKGLKASVVPPMDMR